MAHGHRICSLKRYWQGSRETPSTRTIQESLELEQVCQPHLHVLTEGRERSLTANIRQLCTCVSFTLFCEGLQIDVILAGEKVIVGQQNMRRPQSSSESPCSHSRLPFPHSRIRFEVPPKAWRVRAELMKVRPGWYNRHFSLQRVGAHRSGQTPPWSRKQADQHRGCIFRAASLMGIIEGSAATWDWPGNSRFPSSQLGGYKGGVPP